MIDIMSALENVRFPLSPVSSQTQTHAHAKPPLSPIRSESSYSSNEAIEVFMPKSPTSMMDVRLLHLMDYKMHNVQLKALRAVPSAISFTPIHCENDEETLGGDACSSYTQDDASIEMEEEEDDLLDSTYSKDDTSVKMEEEDDLLGLDLLADDDEEEECNHDEMETETSLSGRGCFSVNSPGRHSFYLPIRSIADTFPSAFHSTVTSLSHLHSIR